MASGAPPDVFISYASGDKTVADQVCATLEGRGIRCWIAPRDARPGINYGASIVDAIDASSVLVFVVSSRAIASPHVQREVERAASNGAYVIPFRIEDVPFSKTLQYFLQGVHWLDALTPPLERHLEYLAETVAGFLSSRAVPTAASEPASRPAAAVMSEPVKRSEWVGGRPEQATTGGPIGDVTAIPSLVAPSPTVRQRTSPFLAIVLALMIAGVGVYVVATKPPASQPAPNPPVLVDRLKLVPTSPTQISPGGTVTFDLTFVLTAKESVAAQWNLAMRSDGSLQYLHYVDFTASPGANRVLADFWTTPSYPPQGVLLVGVIRLYGKLYHTQEAVPIRVVAR